MRPVKAVIVDDVITAYHAGSCLSSGHSTRRNHSATCRNLPLKWSLSTTLFQHTMQGAASQYDDGAQLFLRIVVCMCILAAAKCAIHGKIQYNPAFRSDKTGDTPPVFRLDNPHVKRTTGGPPPSNYPPRPLASGRVDVGNSPS